MNELTDIRTKIHEIRGQQVMLDFDLAELYGVETKQLKRAVRRNLERFPPDFMFELNMEEFNSLKMSIRCQIGTLDVTPGDLPKYAPFAFTEQGVAMLSGVLRSPTAIEGTSESCVLSLLFVTILLPRIAVTASWKVR